MSSSGTEPSVSEANKLEGDDVVATEAVPSKSEAAGVDGRSAEVVSWGEGVLDLFSRYS